MDLSSSLLYLFPLSFNPKVWTSLYTCVRMNVLDGGREWWQGKISVGFGQRLQSFFDWSSQGNTCACIK